MDERQLVIFRLGSEEYGVPIMQVQEINRMTEITKIPQAPDFVEGVINLRGRVIPVIDLAKRFNLKLSGQSDETRIMVVEVDNQNVGIIVDAVTEVTRLAADAIEPAPAIVTNIDSTYIEGVGKLSNRLLILLNLNNVLNSTEKAMLQEIEAAV